MGSRQPTVESLDKLRKLAVSLRLQKKSLNEIQAKTGLSHPTIIAAHKKFLKGGWGALIAGERGRPTGAKNVAISSLLDDLIATTDVLWDLDKAQDWINQQYQRSVSTKSVRRYLQNIQLIPNDEPDYLSRENLLSWLKQRDTSFNSAKYSLLICGFHTVPNRADCYQIYCRDMKQSIRWQHGYGKPNASRIMDFLKALIDSTNKPICMVLKTSKPEQISQLAQFQQLHSDRLVLIPYSELQATQSLHNSRMFHKKDTHINTLLPGKDMPLTHLQRLEAESIQIMREVVAETENPVMLYSIGKDSAVMLHIAMKAFYPSLPPFPLLHVDTRWKFREMYEFRDQMVKNLGLKLISHINPEGIEKNINPFTHGSAIHTDIMKTEGLKQALDKYGFDAAFGGARRDEENSRAKERVFSFRSADHRWDPKNQRPELWKQYNARKHKGESIRVFPISNWTELDIWQYIHLENIPIVPLYYSAERPVVERDSTLIMVDDERMPLLEGEVPMMKSVRFRTLGCYPLTGAVESNADTLPAIIQEMLLTKTSERQGRMIDHDSAASMEKKKQEGYF